MERRVLGALDGNEPEQGGRFPQPVLSGALHHNREERIDRLRTHLHRLEASCIRRFRQVEIPVRVPETREDGHAGSGVRPI